MTNPHPTDPAALARWLRTPRRDPDPVRDAYAGFRAPHDSTGAGTLLAVVIGMLLAALLLLWLTPCATGTLC